MVNDEVGADDVADVVSAWTGIPVGQLLGGETGELPMEDEPGISDFAASAVNTEKAAMSPKKGTVPYALKQAESPQIADEQPTIAGHAFMSYIRENSAEADRLQQVLEAAGVDVWRDTADLWPGEDWREKIRHAIIRDSLVFLACFSKKSVGRETSYQNEELNLAIEQMRIRRPGQPWLIPIRFDDCNIPDLNLGGGRSLGSIQHTDLFGDHFNDAAVRLVSVIHRVLKSHR